MDVHVSLRMSESARHIWLLRILTVLTWLFSLLVVHLGSLLPLFDSSPLAATTSVNSSWPYSISHPVLRWDTFHFAHIAQHGYAYEHERAFLPGASLVMRASAYLSRLVGMQSPDDDVSQNLNVMLLCGMLAAFYCSSTTTLYRLTLHHMKSPSVALLASLLSLLSSSPATVRLAPYNEPFFTYLSYRAMLFSARSEWFLASCFFAAAAVFRSNGIMLSGFIIWGLLIDPFLAKQKITFGRLVYAIALTSMIFLPFVAHQYSAYRDFCQDVITPASWCSRIPPSIYSYVQAQYWGSSFLSYWTLQQLPNFLISAPVVALLLFYSTHYIRSALLPRLRLFLRQSTDTKRKPVVERPTRFVRAKSPFLHPSLAPHAIHALIFTLTLLFAAHTQIILRLAASTPFTYWAAAWLLVEHLEWGKRWIAWSVIWGVVSLLLWATFLPPA